MKKILAEIQALERKLVVAKEFLFKVLKEEHYKGHTIKVGIRDKGDTAVVAEIDGKEEKSVHSYTIQDAMEQAKKFIDTVITPANYEHKKKTLQAWKDTGAKKEAIEDLEKRLKEYESNK